MMKVGVPYGNKFIDIPGSVVKRAIVFSPELHNNKNCHSGITDLFLKAVAEPVSGPGIYGLAAGCKNACIIVSDKTRKYGADEWLVPLIGILNDKGIDDKDIKILLACGTHGRHTEKEKENIVGKAVSGRVNVIDHDCDDSSNVELGVTPAGAPVELNRIAVDADLLIATGVVMPHYYAGFTGGRKSILPGIASRKTIFKNHSLNLNESSGTHPLATTVNLKGNPIHEDMIEALKFIKVDFSIQVVPDADGIPSHIYSGGIVESHKKACEKAKDIFCVSLDEKVDWAVVSCGGAPKDINFYQSHKSLDNAFKAVKTGGDIFLFAECSEGIGPESFSKWFDVNDMGKIEKMIRTEFDIPGHTALRTLEKIKKVNVHLYSELSEDLVKNMGMTYFDSVSHIEDVLSNVAGRGIIMPHAGLTVPVV